MKLIPISEHPDAPKILYDLLGERTPEQSISHRVMPSWEQHLAFIAGEPYTAWYLTQDGGGVVGATYLTKADEIGIGILRHAQGFRCGPHAICRLMQRHGERTYYANISPLNGRSIRTFARLGFSLLREEQTQNVYELTA